MISSRKSLESSRSSWLKKSYRTNVRFSVPRNCSQQLEIVLKNAKHYSRSSNPWQQKRDASKTASTNYSMMADSHRSNSSRKLPDDSKHSEIKNSSQEVTDCSVEIENLQYEFIHTEKDNECLQNQIQRIENKEWTLALQKQAKELNEREKEDIESYKQYSQENETYQIRTKFIEQLRARCNKNLAWKEHHHAKAVNSHDQRLKDHDDLERNRGRMEINEQIKTQRCLISRIEKERRSSSFNEYIAKARQNEKKQKIEEKCEESKHAKSMALGSLIKAKRTNLELKLKLKLVQNLTKN